jgi:O-antigen/teichoic acid export membrane protein
MKYTFNYLNKKNTSESIFVLIITIVTKSLNFILNIFCARILNIESYGLYMLIRNALFTIENIISGSSSSIVIKRISSRIEDKNYVNSYISNYILLNSILVFILVVLFLIIPIDVFNLYFKSLIKLRYDFFIFLSLLFFILNNSFIQKVIIALDLIKFIYTSKILINLSFLYLYYLLIHRYQLYGAFYSLLLFYISDIMVSLTIMVKKFSYKFDLSSFNNFLSIKDNAHLFISSSFTLSLFFYLRIYIVKNTNSYATIAIFDTYYQFFSFIMILTGATTSVTLKQMSKDINLNSVKKILFESIFVNIILVLFSGLILYLFFDIILGLYGNIFLDYKYLITIIIAISIFASISSLFNKYFIVINKTRYVTYETILSSLATFVFVLSFHHNNLVLSMSFSYLFFYCISTILSFLFFLRC